MGWVKDDVMFVSSNNSSADADSSYSALEICSYVCVCDNAHEAFVFHCYYAINELKFHSLAFFMSASAGRLMCALINHGGASEKTNSVSALKAAQRRKGHRRSVISCGASH